MGKRKRPRTKAEQQADKVRSGRPPKAEAEKLSERVTVHLTPNERKKIAQMAKEEGLSLAAMIMRPWRKGV